MTRQSGSYDLILVGSSFASAFFLHAYRRRRPDGRVLVLERGARLTHAEHGRLSGRLQREADASFINHTPDKPWIFRLAFGGASNCWAACTPRFLTEDFEMQTRYGVAVDWPLRYDDLETYYCEAEDIMAVSGPKHGGPWPRSRPYPQPPHRMAEPDRLLRAADPAQWFEQPCARPSRPVPSGRAVCCTTGVCAQCPVDAKFTVMNELDGLFAGDAVELRVGARVLDIEHTGSAASGVRWMEGGEERRARGDLVAIGANAIFNPHLLLRSGLDGPEVGRGLVEQRSVAIQVDLDGVDGFGGSTLMSALGYPLYGGAHRATRAAAMIESRNAPIALRDVRGRWRQLLRAKVIYEDLRQPGNRVTLAPDDPDRPVVTFARHSTYTDAAMDRLESDLPQVLEALPIEDIRIGSEAVPTEAHIECTTPMGRDPATSVVDADLRHHTVRNLLVLGSSVFPTCPPANPTLTLTALSLRAAERLFA